MNVMSLGFCSPTGSALRQSRLRHVATVDKATHVRHSSFVSPSTRSVSIRPPSSATSSRRVPHCQIPGNIEDIPAERIPIDVEALPQYWSRPGVYGVYNSAKELLYVAAVEDVRAAMATHVRVINDADKLFAVRMLTVENVDDAPLGMMAENWVMAQHEYGPGLPPGNTDQDPSWRATDEKLEDVYFAPGVEMDMVDAEIKSILRKNTVVLFMKGTHRDPKCKFSKTVVGILDELAADYVCVDCLDELRNKGLRDQIKVFSKWPTIPQLYVNGDFVGGADIVTSMLESGELKSLLAPAPA